MKVASFSLRTATLDDAPVLERLIADSARGLSRHDYTDTQIEADTTAAGFTLRLPRISEYSRNRWKVRRSAGANVLTIAPRGSDTINSSATIAVTKQVEIYAVTNSNWRAIVVEV